MKNARAQAIIERMRWGLGLAGLAAIAAIVLAVLLVGPPARRSAPGPEPATSPAPSPAAPSASALAPVAPLVSTPTETTAERRAATRTTEERSAPEAVISGSVFDEQGSGLPGISITAVRASGSPDPEAVATTSDERGGFRLVLVGSARPTHARFESGDYLPRVLEVPAAVPTAGPWEVVLEARPVIAGLVLDRDGAPVAPPGRVSVRILPSDPAAEEQHSADLGPDGRYLLHGLPTGRLVQIWARAKAFDKHVVDLDLPLTAGSLQTHDLILERGLVVYGVVLDELTSEPVPFAKVWGESFDYEEHSFHPTTRADAQGRFRIEGFESNLVEFGDVAYHTFMIVASSEEHASSPLSISALTPDENGEFEVELLLARSSCSVGGIVFRSDGETPCADAFIWAIDAGNNYTLQTTDEAGEFHFGGLAAGPFAMQVYRTSRESGGLYESLRLDLDLQDGAAEDLRLTLATSTGASIAGHVLDAAGAPVAGIEVTASFQFHAGGLTMGLDSEASFTDADGRYRFPDTRAGLYVIAPAGCAEPQSFQLTLAPFEQRVIDFVAGDCMTIEGWIELGEAAASEFEVRLFSLEGQMIQDAELQADGSFHVPDVIAGSYELVLFRNGERLDVAPVDATSPTGIVLRVP